MGLDETFSNEEEEIVSFNYEEFTKQEINTKEHTYYNGLCDICHLAHPPHETGDAASWVFVLVKLYFIGFVPTTHHQTYV